MGPACPRCRFVHELGIGELEERVFAPRFFFCERCMNLFVVDTDEMGALQARYWDAQNGRRGRHGRAELQQPSSSRRAPPPATGNASPGRPRAPLGPRSTPTVLALILYHLLGSDDINPWVQLADGMLVDLGEPRPGGYLVALWSVESPACIDSLPAMVREARREYRQPACIPLDLIGRDRYARRRIERLGLHPSEYALPGQPLALLALAMLRGSERELPFDFPPAVVRLDHRREVAGFGSLADVRFVSPDPDAPEPGVP